LKEGIQEIKGYLLDADVEEWKSKGYNVQYNRKLDTTFVWKSALKESIEEKEKLKVSENNGN
jgi:hypothetical protein